MLPIVLLTLLSFSWIIFSWIAIYYPKKVRWYLLPYFVFQLGQTLIVYSVVFVSGWENIGYGSLGVALIGLSIFLLVIVKVNKHNNHTKNA
ncbi:hypothetical protein [Pseudalkalibacillus sp. SCS-8]|uniref:hypothetical protein n=1 Tax=Pseudalkalibacillus nanhaiensis TaxID=3115291 RepID=UPI0032DBB130